VISFIIPAHNEELLLGRTLASVKAAACEMDEPFEIIVVDDASTDATASIARDHGARLVQVNYRQIAATRNAGARDARGEWFFFIDADTVMTAAALRAALRGLRRGAVGGGCVFLFDGRLPLYAKIIHTIASPLAHHLKFVSGCCLFCTRAAFKAVGGFPENYFAAEELVFVASLKRQGRFVVPRERVITSGRKVRTHSLPEALAIMLRVLLRGPSRFRSRKGLDLWYGPRRRDPDEHGLSE
jgi:glycosyltransferase involved in cell wall biosynthesis